MKPGESVPFSEMALAAIQRLDPWPKGHDAMIAEPRDELATLKATVAGLVGSTRVATRAD